MFENYSKSRIFETLKNQHKKSFSISAQNVCKVVTDNETIFGSFQTLNGEKVSSFFVTHSLVIQGCGDTKRKMVLPVGSWHQIEVELIQISIKRIVA